MFFFVVLLHGLLGGLSVYVIQTSPEMFKMNEGLDELAGQSSLISEVISGIGSSFASAMIGKLFIAAIYKIFMMFFGDDTPYKALLNIVLYTNIILINTILSLIFGSGMTQYTSLGLLFNEGTFVYGISIALCMEFSLNLAWMAYFS